MVAVREIAALRSSLTGEIIEPEDPRYDKARSLFYGGIDKRPAAILRVANAQDAARVIQYARETGVELAVRSGGHSPVGSSLSDGGIVLDLHDMRRVEVDVAKRTAWAETGATAVEFATAAGAHGLGVSFGDTGSVGLGGITLGGGVGYLVRKHGLTIDNLIAAEIVTADGTVRRIDAEHEPDLFWAIRGGGGNFGVATRLHFRLHQVDPFVGGMLMQPASAQFIHDFIAISAAAPEELTTIANVMPAPPMPFVPAEWHNKLVAMSFVCYAGGGDAAERAIAPLRKLATPIVDMVKLMPYAQIYPPEDDSYHPIGTGRNMLVDAIDKRSAESMIEYLSSSPATFSVAQLRVMRGAVARVPDDATAYAHRRRFAMINIGNLVQSVEELTAIKPWVDSFEKAIQRGPEAAYVNFLMDEGPERVRRAYPAGTYERLMKVKRQYDPTNLFRLNQNIPPSA
ncbi:MAG: FAD-binding oxidoreductase [Chloroflexi bacterium]|nr:MAG: FAD-binding oxidoreductase [Chloroflexota bacterium]